MQTHLAAIDWDSILQQPDFAPMVLGFGTVAIVILGITIAVQWRKAQQAKCNAQLKERMIEHGFTAEEIDAVISATPNRHRKRVMAIGAHVIGPSTVADGMRRAATGDKETGCTPNCC